METKGNKRKQRMSRTGIIYKLCCKNVDITECYVGSTINLSRRKHQHKIRCNNQNNNKYYFKVYQYIRENGGFDNWDIIQLETIQFNDRYELNARERVHLEQLHATLNKQIPTRTKKQYYMDNREKYLQKSKNFRENNPELVAQQLKEWCENNKEKVKEDNKIRGKKWRENNKERAKQWREQIIVCECGKPSQLGQISRHKKSKQHQFFENYKDYLYS